MAGVNKISVDGVFYDVDDVTAVDYSDAQSLTDAQQEQARTNIRAVSSDDVTDDIGLKIVNGKICAIFSV